MEDDIGRYSGGHEETCHLKKCAKLENCRGRCDRLRREFGIHVSFSVLQEAFDTNPTSDSNLPISLGPPS